MSEWIPIKTMFPESDVPVLVYTSDGFITIACNDSLTGWTTHDNRLQWGKTISYWRPLPDPPGKKPGDDLDPEVKEQIKAGVDKMFNDEHFKKLLMILHDKIDKSFDND